ncbi:MAG: Ig-like domain-containing protein [Gammaproteobacteria bacterium]|nr:Ig-like domain-containing protein [Gammaproteobacteria bacterium]
MRKLSYLTALLATLLLGACSGGEGFVTDPNVPIGPPPPAASAITVLSSSPSLPSDTGQTVTISAIVRDANNVAMPDVTVVMSTDSGTLTIVNPITDASGVVTATLSGGGDPTNRVITVTADATGIVGTVAVNVIGTTLTISGPAALPQGDAATYTIFLADAAGNGLANQQVDITSENGNTIDQASVTTDVSGQAQIEVAAAVAGDDTLTATALGLTAIAELTVSDDSFVLTAPAAGTEVVLNTAVDVDLTWSVAGAPQAGETINFSATRGTLSAFSAVTDAAGVATVTIQSTNAGPSVITATNSVGTSTSVEIEFIADQPDNIEAQATPFTIGPNEQSAITAIVRDVNNNLVKNEIVQFDLDDVSGGQLSVANAVTDSQGRAQTFYTASSTTSANNGVVITATVTSDPTIFDSVALTVAQRELFLSIGTGNEIFEPNSAQYRQEFVVLATDSQGNGVEGVNVQVGVLSDYYRKGFWVFDPLIPAWVAVITSPNCIDEDINNRNGVLDPGEDNNGNGRIEAGNIAAVAAQNGSGGTFVTDSSGLGIVDLIYPQDHGVWVGVTITATTSVQGTEFARSSTFVLPVSGDDVADQNVSPPGNPSPYGTGGSCADTL